MFDLAWLVGECPRLTSVPVVLVHGERDRHRWSASSAVRGMDHRVLTEECMACDERSMDRECAAFSNITPVAPPLPIPYGTHHTKMMVVVFPDKVRVAIFTANFIPNDWDSKTQGVWCQEFGLKVLPDSSDEDEDEKEGHSLSAANGSTPGSKIKLPDFEVDLIDYLSRLGSLVAAFCRELHRFDFSTARVALVPSIPGIHKGKGA